MTAFEGPWARDRRGVFVAPDGSRPLVDLSPVGSPGTRGLFWATVNLGLDYRIVADPTAYIWEALTTLSAPDGLGNPKPLIPGRVGLELYLGPLGRVRHERFAWGHPHMNRVRDVLRADFARYFTRNTTHARKCLDWWRVRYRVDWREFVPPDLLADVEGPLPHNTTITESFNTGDTSTLGPDLSWTELLGGWEVLSNQCGRTAGATNQQNRARADSDLSSDDHYAQAACYYPASNTYHGPACRMPSDTTVDFYSFVTDAGDATAYLIKMDNGSQTNIDTGSPGSRVDGTIAKVEANGSTITGYYGGSSIASTTDTAITGNTRCGLNAFGGPADAGIFDTFEAADLAAATGNRRRRVLICGSR